MTKGEKSKQLLIECAARLFWRNGYNSTGLSDILIESGLSKGSFYFYFKSKKELASAVIAYYEQVIIEKLKGFSQGSDWETFVTAFTAFMKDAADNGNHYGCPFAAIGIELAWSEPDIALQYKLSLQKITELFQTVLKNSGISEQKAPRLAEIMFSIYEGELLLYRLDKNAEHFNIMKTNLVTVYNSFS
jgi:AcrR family transcriptional regulator